MLTTTQSQSFWEKGYLHIPQVFSGSEVDELSDEMNRLMHEWAVEDQGWTGDWRQAYMDPATERKSKLIAMHDLWLYSSAWLRAVTNPRLIASLTDLMGPDVELHHSSMHVKPPETGHPFPMHQDNPFYEHVDERYVDVLVHLDDTCHENGEIRCVEGSHKQGALPHVLMKPNGTACTPHLPTDLYKLEQGTPIPARRGDVVCFNIFTIHGSHINQTNQHRRLVRVGYRHPENRQTAGQSLGRPSMMVAGQRRRRMGEALFRLE